MRRTTGSWICGVLAVYLFALGVPLIAQGSLSEQVLALLSRTNSWIGKNTFYNIRIPKLAVPSDTDARIYADASGNLYYQTTLLAAAGGGTTPHNLLSSTHPDTSPASPPARGAVIAGNSSSLWATVAPASGFVQYNGTDTVFATSLALGTNIPAAQLTGSLPAISGASLTGLNASALASGTVPLARVSGLTNTQVDAAAAIAYSKLALTGAVVNADISAIAAIAYSKLNLANEILATDLATSAVTMSKIAQAGATTGQVLQWGGTAWAPATIGTGGTVTSVGLSLPGIFSVAGSPVTSAGTLSASLLSQAANAFFAAPDGVAGAPIMRLIVNADLPTTGVSPGTFREVTVNAQGVVTSGAASIDLSTNVSGTLAAARGGVPIALTAATIPVANGSAWVSTAVPACTRLIGFDTVTRLFACNPSLTFGTVTVTTPLAFTETWNNAGVIFNAVDYNITDNASLPTSTLVTYRVGGTSQWALRKNGMSIQAGVAFAALGTAPNGGLTWCPDCAVATTPCTGASSGAWAFADGAGAWNCPF